MKLPVLGYIYIKNAYISRYQLDRNTVYNPNKRAPLSLTVLVAAPKGYTQPQYTADKTVPAY